MSTITTDLIEIRGPENSIDVRDIVEIDGVRQFWRHPITEACHDNDHALAKAIRAALPYDRTNKLFDGDGTHVVPNFIRVQVKSGIVRVDTTTFVVKGGEIIAAEKQRPVVIQPGADTSELDPKLKAVCGVVHTPEVVQAWIDLMAAAAAEKKALADAQVAAATQADKDFKQEIADEVARQLAG